MIFNYNLGPGGRYELELLFPVVSIKQIILRYQVEKLQNQCKREGQTKELALEWKDRQTNKKCKKRKKQTHKLV